MTTVAMPVFSKQNETVSMAMCICLVLGVGGWWVGISQISLHLSFREKMASLFLLRLPYVSLSLLFHPTVRTSESSVNERTGRGVSISSPSLRHSCLEEENS